MSTTNNILFLGATGGCILTTLVQTLKFLSAPATSSSPSSQHKAIALVRSAAKLRTLLVDQEHLEASILANHLIIVEGNATDAVKMKEALLAGGAAGDHGTGVPRLPSLIVSGTGSLPKLQLSIRQPFGLQQPHICEQTVQTVLTALEEIKNENESATAKPSLLFISSTGLAHNLHSTNAATTTTATTSAPPRDLPLLFSWIYRFLLTIPHDDKAKSETLVRSNTSAHTTVTTNLLKSSIIIRPSFFASDTNPNREIRTGTEPNPAVGYFVSRKEVGTWIFEEVVKAFVLENGCRWEGEKVTLTR